MLSLMFLVVSASGAFGATYDQVPKTGSATSETWLSNQVRHQLLTLPFYSVFDNLEYKVEGSKVTLLGQVVQPVLKDDAASAVKHIEGVQVVDNRIEVLPLSPFDDRIRRAEYRAIFRSPGLEKYSLGTNPSIHIIVDRGHVTLEGAVISEGDRTLANLRANGVPDVFSVTNHLGVDRS
jgi:hyperosmotically inducible protein